MMAVPLLRGGWISAYQVSFNYFRKWIYAWNGALSPSASLSEVIVPAFPYRFATLHIFPLPSFSPSFLSFLSFFFFISLGNISWKSGNNLLSLPPVIYRPPLFRNVPDRISPFNLPAFIPRYRAPLRPTASPLRFHRYEISTITKVTRVCVEKKEKEEEKKKRITRALSSEVKGGKFSKNEQIRKRERERERERRNVLRSNANDDVVS